MRPWLLCAGGVLTLGAFLAGQTITRSRISTGLSSIQISRLRADLDYLTSDKLAGRLSLRPGSELAARWVADEFRKAGLKAGAGSSYLQPVPLIEYTVDRAASGLTVQMDGKTEHFSAPDATGGFPESRDVKGSVVFAGFGITAPELNYDDYAGIDVKGKIVLIFDHEPQENDAKSRFNGKGNTRYAGSYMKTLTAQKHGAVGVLVAPEPNRKHPSNQERLARVRGMNLRARMPSQALESSELRIPSISINDAIADRLLKGDGKALQSKIDTALQPVSRETGATAEIKIVVTTRRRANTWNVLGVVEGSDPVLKAETIVFSAHYDHDGPAAGGGIYRGADDDGSGTVGVVELARAFARNEVKPRRSLLFAVFAAEERGLLGSYYYAAHPTRPLSGTRAVINFDMIGRDEAPSDQTRGLVEISPDTTNELNLVGTNYSPDYRESVIRANNMVELKLNYKWDEEPALNVFFRSDHYPFALHDIPSVWWFTGFHPDYHQTSDTADKIDYTKMEKILKLAFITGFEFGDTSEPPKFQP